MSSKSKSEWIEKEDYRKKILFVEDDLDCKGTKVQIVEIERDNEVDTHYHKKQTEVFNIQNGKGIIGIDNEEHKVDQGDFLICKPFQPHHVENKGNEPLKILVFKTNYDYDEEDSYWEE